MRLAASNYFVPGSPFSCPDLSQGRQVDVGSQEKDLFKDKIEVRLDERQVFYLFFGGAVIATLVFVLGVMVGRRVEARAVVAGASTISDPLAALDRLEAGGDDLAFPTALRGDESIALGSVDTNLAERPRPAPKPKRQALVVEAEPEAASKPGQEKAEKPKKAEKEADAKPDAKKLKKRFTLQVGSFQDKDEADTFFRSLEGGNYTPYMVEAEVPGKGTYFRVRVGGYPTFDEALEAKSKFEDSQHVIAYVTRLK